MGQSAAASGVKFRPGPSSEKVGSGLVWRFGTFDCVSDNLAHFENGFGNSGSFLDIGSHRFYIAKPSRRRSPTSSTLSATEARAMVKAAILAPWSR
jgi:hypothetical protein